MIPDLYHLFPPLSSPHVELVREHNLEWVKRFRLVEGETALQYYFALDTATFVCKVHPKAGLEELCLLCDWFIWYTIFDDYVDGSKLFREVEPLQVFQDHLLSLLQDPPCLPPRGPLAEAFFDCWERTCLLTSSVWQMRFAQNLADWFASQRWEREVRTHRYPLRRDAYIQRRRKTVGFIMGSGFLELADHNEIPAEIYASQIFQDLLQTMADVLGWTNDLYSLKKDFAHGEICNLVFIVQHDENCSLQEAYRQVRIIVELQMRHFQELVQNLPSYPIDVGHCLLSYLDSLGLYVRGLQNWKRAVLRYTGSEYLELGKVSDQMEEIPPLS